MGRGWIEDVKRAATFAEVAAQFGMVEHGRKRWKPCPACNRDRTDSDARSCVGVGADGSWKCFACGEKGDALTLLCWKLTGASSPSEDGWAAVRAFAVERGWLRDNQPTGPAQRVRQFGKAVAQAMQRPAARPAGPPVSPDETPEEKAVNTRGLFRWSDDLPERCALAFRDPASMGWGADYMRIGAQINSYLTEYRKVSDQVLVDAKIGIYVGEDGRPVFQEGRPFITIPLADKSGRFVNIHFRRIPIPGTCKDCDALGLWKECEPCRKGKRYRLCPQRPTPLYGADRLTPGKGQAARIMEGEFDVLALRTYGIGENTVSGTTGASNFADDWLDSLEGFDSIYLCYDDDPSGQKGAAELATKLGTYKCSKVVFPKKDAGDCLIAGVPAETMDRAFKVAESYLEIKLKKASDYAVDLHTLLERPETLKGVSTGSEVLDTAIGGWANGLVVVTGESGAGKAQPVDEPVLTPTGWRPIGKIRVGDEVISVDGKPTKVVGVFPQGVRPICAVEFSDGVKVRCDWDHLWAVASDLDVWKGRDWRVLTAREIAGSIEGSARTRWRVPLPSPISFPPAALPLDPYVLGVLIGDGCLTQTGVRFSSPDQPILDEIARRLPAGMEVHARPSPSKAYDCSITSGKKGQRNSIATALRDLGLLGCLSVEKFIPPAYFLGSMEQRLDLLRGLLDTDGYVSMPGQVTYGTSSQRLAEDVGQLVRSLGGSALMGSKIPKYTYKGERRDGQIHFSVNIALPATLHRKSLLLPRKAERLKDREVQGHRKIVAVREAGEAECVCIAVAHPSQLYVTTGYTVTHNTTWTTWALWKLAHLGHTVAITSFEQQPIMTVLQLLSMELGGDPTERSRDDREAALARLSDLPLYIVDHYGQMPWSKLEDALKYAVRRCGVRYILIDHLGFLIDPDAEDERRAIQAVIRSMVLLRKDMDVTMYLIVHPRNDPDAGKKFGRVTMQHLKGASAIRQDADLVLVVTRELPNTERGRLLSKGKRRPWPQARIYIDKKRGRFGAVSGAGEIVMAYDPKSQTFADTWDQTPMGRSGELIDTTPQGVSEEPEQPKKRARGKGGTRSRRADTDDESNPQF